METNNVLPFKQPKNTQQVYTQGLPYEPPVYQCGCGNDLWYITPDALECARCGALLEEYPE